MRFVDTNILLYAISKDPAEAEKAAAAVALLESDDLATSVQVPQEFYVQATRPGRRGRLTHSQGRDFLNAMKRLPIQVNSVPVMDAALESAHRWRISYWDAAVVEAARAIGCNILLTEDLNREQDFHGLKVFNPFR